MGRPRGSKNKISKKIDVACLMCGKKFAVNPHKIKDNRGKYCSKKCDNKRKRKIKHGFTGSNFYYVWHAIKKRCVDKKCKNYKFYGKKGIKICNEWLNFANFKKDMYLSYLEHSKRYGGEQTSIDRIDNKGNYEASNCRWATKQEQSNNMSTNRFLIFNNQKLTIAEWSRKTKLKYSIIRWRITNNWSIEKTLTTPKKLKSCKNLR